MPTVYGSMQGLQRKTPPIDFVPADFDEMYRCYYVYVLKILTRYGISFQNADDVAQNLFLKMREKDLLGNYDPEHRKNGRKASFVTSLTGFVLVYMRHYRHRLAIQQNREPQWIDQEHHEAAHSKLERNEIDSLALLGHVHEEHFTILQDREFALRMRAHLATIPPKRRDSQLDLVALFDAVLEQIILDGSFSTSLLMVRFDKTRTTIHNWMNELRSAMTAVIDQRALV